MAQNKINLKDKILRFFPLILLYFSVLNEFDLTVSSLGYFHLIYPL